MQNKQSNSTKISRQTKLKTIIKYRDVYILLLPMIIWFLVFNYKPMIGLIIAFKEYSPWKGTWSSPFIGLENFKILFNSPYFFRGIKNTVLLSLYQLLVGFPLPIGLALLFNEARNSLYKKGLQTVLFLPHFISDVVLAGIVIMFLSPSTGVVNMGLEKLGLEKIYFLAQPDWFRSVFISSNIWKNVGFGSIVYTAAIAGVNPNLYEAARIDGANKFHEIINVTLPSIMPTIIIMLIIRIGNIFTIGFEKVILLYQPATYETSDILSTYVYRTGIVNGDYGIATAGGLFEAIIALVFVIGANRLSKKVSSSGLW